MTAACVRTAVIPAAGLGTRFLPATKAVPKELLTVVDRPAIQWVVEEAVAAGIDEIVIVTSPHKKSIEDHFAQMTDLESVLEEKGESELLARVRHANELANVRFVSQASPLGLGHAISMAAPHVGDEPFAVLLPDDLFPDEGRTVRRMIDVAESVGESVVSLTEAVGEEITKYGCAGYSKRDGAVVVVDRLVEKPVFERAPSNLRINGRYVLTPDIFDKLACTEPGRGGEIQLTDALALQIGDRGLRGLVVDDVGFDTGSRAEWLRANVELSLRGSDGSAVAAMLEAALESNGF